MEFFVNPRPCLLLEAAELVYARVNNIPAEELTCDAPYAIPAEEIRRIMEQVCGGLELASEEVQFYFHGVPVVNYEQRLSCVSHVLLYFNMILELEDPEAMVQELKKQWQELERPFKITNFSGGYSFAYADTESYTNLAREIRKLPVPESYQFELIDALSSFEYHVDRLCQLLKPLCLRLQPLLEPWVAAAAPRRVQWEAFLASADAVAVLQKSCDVSNILFNQVRVTLRYFSPGGGPGYYLFDTGVICYHLGVSSLPGVSSRAKRQTLDKGDFGAIRLLSTPDRYAVFHALWKRKKTIQELSNELGVNPGTIFRMVNNMYNVGLLNVDVEAGRNYYIVNRQRLESLGQKLLRSLEQE